MDRIKFERVVRKRGGIAMVLRLLFVEENAERMERKRNGRGCGVRRLVEHRSGREGGWGEEVAKL